MSQGGWQTKPIEMVVEEVSENLDSFGKSGHFRLERSIGSKELILFGFSRTVGAGVFLTLGTVAGDLTGPSIIISLLMTAIGALFSGFALAELASMIPLSGGVYSIAYVTIGELPAWLVGWSLILSYFVNIAFAGQLWTQVIAALSGGLKPSIGAPPTGVLFNPNGQFGVFDVFAFLTIAASAIAASRSTRLSIMSSSILTGFKITVLILFIFAGSTFITTGNYTPFALADKGFGGTLTGIAPLFLGFIGFEAIPNMAQEARDAPRDIPYAVVATLVFATLLYVTVASILVGVSPTAVLKGDVFALANSMAQPIMNGTMLWLKALIHVAALLALISIMLTTILALSRLLYSMSSDGLLPPMFSTLDMSRPVPTYSIAFIGIGAALLGGLVGVPKALPSLGVLLAILTACYCLVTFRRTHPPSEFPRLFVCPFVPLVPMIAGLICLAQLIILLVNDLVSLAVIAIWLAVGAFYYYCVGSSNGVIARINSPDFQGFRKLDQEIGLINAVKSSRSSPVMNPAIFGSKAGLDYNDSNSKVNDDANGGSKAYKEKEIVITPRDPVKNVNNISDDNNNRSSNNNVNAGISNNSSSRSQLSRQASARDSSPRQYQSSSNIIINNNRSSSNGKSRSSSNGRNINSYMDNPTLSTSSSYSGRASNNPYDSSLIGQVSLQELNNSSTNPRKGGAALNNNSNNGNNYSAPQRQLASDASMTSIASSASSFNRKLSAPRSPNMSNLNARSSSNSRGSNHSNSNIPPSPRLGASVPKGAF